MMSELTRLRDEAARLLGTYELHRDSADEVLRRKVHIDLDRFLMEHRETAMILMVNGLDAEIQQLSAARRVLVKRPWWKRLGGNNAKRKTRDVHSI